MTATETKTRPLARTASMWFRTSFSATLLAGALVLLGSVGCGGGNADSARLSGQVTIGGEPVPAEARASITFRPQGKSTGQSVTVLIENSRYDSPATPLGAVKAYFKISVPTGETYTNDRGAQIDVTEDLVPDEHLQGIELTVDKDKSDADFSL